MSISIGNLVFLIMVSAALLFFAVEIGDKSKRLWDKTWVKIVIPLAVASVLAVVFQNELYESFNQLIKLMHRSTENMMRDIGHSELVGEVSLTITLIIYTLLPYSVVQLMHRLLNRKWYPHPWELSLYLWLFVSGLNMLDPVHL